MAYHFILLDNLHIIAILQQVRDFVFVKLKTLLIKVLHYVRFYNVRNWQGKTCCKWNRQNIHECLNRICSFHVFLFLLMLPRDHVFSNSPIWNLKYLILIKSVFPYISLFTKSKQILPYLTLYHLDIMIFTCKAARQPHKQLVAIANRW
jgi:hypothetical protein